MHEETNLLLLIRRAQEDFRQVHRSLLEYTEKFPAASAESVVLDYLDQPFEKMGQHLSRAEDYLTHREFHAELTNEEEAA